MTTINWKSFTEDYQKELDNIKLQSKIMEDFSNENEINLKYASIILKWRNSPFWTQEKENYLIWLSQNNKNIMIVDNDFEVPENYKTQ
jgi:hypothetical protein